MTKKQTAAAAAESNGENGVKSSQCSKECIFSRMLGLFQQKSHLAVQRKINIHRWPNFSQADKYLEIVARV